MSSGYITVAFWEWMSADLGDLIEVGKNLNAEQYVNIFDGVMLPNEEIIVKKPLYDCCDGEQ